MINLPEKLPDSIDRIITDLFQPLASKVGTAAADAASIVLDPISDYAEKCRIKRAVNTQNLKNESVECIARIKSGDLKEPNTQILLQAVEQSKYCIDEDILRKMFAQLIASTFMRSREDPIHPSFAHLITQLSPYDAYSLIRIETCDVVPIIRVIGDIPTSESSVSIFQDIWEPVKDSNSLKRTQRTINSLQRLGLVNITYDASLADNSKYNSLFDDTLKRLATEECDPIKYPDLNLSIIKGYVTLTQLGRDFVICVKP